jgi:hypothetical protein
MPCQATCGIKGDIISNEVLMLPPEIANIVKLAGKKTRQHYVFQHYLRAWAVDGKVWTRRRDNKKVFNAGTNKVAAERHFYKLQPVTTEDLTLIRLLLINDAPFYVKERCETLIHNMTVPLAIKRAIDPANPELEEISAWLDEHIINAEENLQCDVESGLIQALDDMLNGKTDFFLESDPAQEFIHAICFQYMRTKKMRDGIEAIGPTPVPGSDMKRCGNLYMLISAMRFADALYRRRAQYKIVILDNTTDIPFITGDQPIFNIHATFRSGAMPERLELFYPLSPKRAMALLELATERSTVLSMNEVQQFNEMVAWNSHEQVFSNSGVYLEGLEMDGPPA